MQKKEAPTKLKKLQKMNKGKSSVFSVDFTYPQNASILWVKEISSLIALNLQYLFFQKCFHDGSIFV